MQRAKKAELAASYLQWTSDPIHKSLMDVSGLKGEAKKQFKNLLGYCGDRKYQYPDPLIRDIVAKGEFVGVDGGGGQHRLVNASRIEDDENMASFFVSADGYCDTAREQMVVLLMEIMMTVMMILASSW